MLASTDPLLLLDVPFQVLTARVMAESQNCFLFDLANPLPREVHLLTDLLEGQGILTSKPEVEAKDSSFALGERAQRFLHIIAQCICVRHFINSLLVLILEIVNQGIFLLIVVKGRIE